jgi:hypothetical protein
MVQQDGPQGLPLAAGIPARDRHCAGVRSTPRGTAVEPRSALPPCVNRKLLKMNPSDINMISALRVRNACIAHLARRFARRVAPLAAFPDDRPRTGREALRKFLIILDDTPEMLNAMRYAAIRASKTGGGVEMLAVISPAEFQAFAGVADVMRAEAQEKIEAHFQVFKDRMDLRDLVLVRGTLQRMALNQCELDTLVEAIER